MKSKQHAKYLAIIAVILGMTLVPAIAGFAAGNPKKGERIYNQYCVPCHGRTGHGDGTRAKTERLDPQPRNHTDGKYMNKRTDLQLFKVDKLGGKANNFSHIMPQ